jgi:hypothetical protein
LAREAIWDMRGMASSPARWRMRVTRKKSGLGSCPGQVPTGLGWCGAELALRLVRQLLPCRLACMMAAWTGRPPRCWRRPPCGRSKQRTRWCTRAVVAGGLSRAWALRPSDPTQGRGR